MHGAAVGGHCVVHFGQEVTVVEDDDDGEDGDGMDCEIYT